MSFGRSAAGAARTGPSKVTGRAFGRDQPGRILGVVSERTDRLEQAFAALDRGDVSGFRELFAEEAQWLGVPGSGFDGATPT